MKARMTVKKGLTAGALGMVLGTSVLVLPSCTDLNESPFSAITAENFYNSPADYFTGLAGVYAQTRSVMWNWFNLNEVTTDEAVVPTRGTDWYDGGRWLALHRHTWDPTLTDLNGAWNDAFTGVSRANELLNALEGADFEGASQIAAEARFLRAFFYSWLMDYLGGVPIITEDEIPVDQANPPAANTRAEVFQFIVDELNAIREELPPEYPADGYGRATRGAANALLANLYLNAQVYTGTVTEAGLQPGQAMWQEAIDAADRVISADYDLVDDWFANFSPLNNNSPELIWVIPNLAEADLGNTLPMRTLHYNQLQEGPWNGFATIAETYEAFDPDDQRTDMWLVGQAFSFETGEPVNNRQGQPLIFTPEIGNVENATEGEGVRFNKYIPDLDNVGGNHGNDFVMFRLAEMYLIKAEALNELGQTNEAVQIINMLRERVFEPDEPITATGQAEVREAILEERLFELAFEGKRRQDLIRFGRYDDTWAHKTNTDPYRILFPIPALQLGANPNLQQNPGY